MGGSFVIPHHCCGISMHASLSHPAGIKLHLVSSLGKSFHLVGRKNGLLLLGKNPPSQRGNESLGRDGQGCGLCCIQLPTSTANTETVIAPKPETCPPIFVDQLCVSSPRIKSFHLPQLPSSGWSWRQSSAVSSSTRHLTPQGIIEFPSVRVLRTMAVSACA